MHVRADALPRPRSRSAAGRTLIGQAKADRFSAMKLDTGHMMTEASAMYRALGFLPCAPYVDYPEAMAALMVFMERPLAG